MTSPGWERIRLGDQECLRVVFPEPLEGHLRAYFVLKGPWTAGTRGNPEEILKRSRDLRSSEPDLPERWIAPVQRHGIDILQGDRASVLPLRPDGDGVFLKTPGTGLLLRYADCVPVLLAGRLPRPWALGLHAGYAGVTEDLVGAGFERLFGHEGQDEEDLWAWIGPGIGKCCYVRDEDDPGTARGKRRLPPACWDEEEGGKVRFDLKGALRLQLRRHVPEERIFDCALCTAHEGAHCLSYRRGDQEDRMALLAWIHRCIPPFQATSPAFEGKKKAEGTPSP